MVTNESNLQIRYSQKKKDLKNRMDNNNTKQSKQQQMLPYMQPWYPPEDEISLLDLWKVLVEQKK